MKSYYLRLYAYNRWTNRAILACVKALPSDKYVQPRQMSWNSLRGTFVHIFDAERIWRQRMQGDSPELFLSETDFADIASLEAAWLEEMTAMEEYIQSLPATAFAESFEYHTTAANPAGKQARRNIRSEAFTHVVLHGMQHRSEAAVVLTELGQSPGDIDFLTYLRLQSG